MRPRAAMYVIQTSVNVLKANLVLVMTILKSDVLCQDVIWMQVSDSRTSQSTTWNILHQAAKRSFKSTNEILGQSPEYAVVREKNLKSDNTSCT